MTTQILWRKNAVLAAGLSWLAACLLLISAVAANAAAVSVPIESTSDSRRVIIAVADKPTPAPSAGATPRGYAGVQTYAGGERAITIANDLARDYDLREVSAWTIEPLRLRCMLYELSAAADREAVLARLRKDDRVRLVQASQSFDTYTAPPSVSSNIAIPAAQAAAYNDPYIGLQHGFTGIGAGQAQHWSSGAGIRVALIDTGVDASHPDLLGRIDLQHDFVTDSADLPNTDRHGTEVAGVIAAVANNGVGIVGVAPDAHILSYRACWPAQANASAAHCNTFTLARALGAAIASGAPIINLSLGGPSDPLLEQLVDYALKHGAIVVGAVPPDGRMDGFPVNVKGVIAVNSTEDPRLENASLVAPGRDILTLEPGGRYDYASGSSLATAHVSGAIALLLALDHHLNAAALLALLHKSQNAGDAQINVCAAALALGQAKGGCTDTALHAE